MKVGSRVEIIHTDYETGYFTHLENGQQGQVVEVYDDGSLYVVKMDNDPDPNDDWSFYPHEVKELK